MRKNKVFIACDTTNIRKIKNLIKETQNKKIIFGYKFGLELLNSKDGRKFVSTQKKQITFGDYKFHDIPNTCASALKAVSDLKFNYITIHISSGLNALKAAKKKAGKTKLIGVSVLTSLDKKTLEEIGHNQTVKKIVKQHAKLASKANLDAIVCSAREVKDVRKIFKKEIITPGIRFKNNFDDQKRVMTPKEAFKNGSDWIVIGRPITKGNIKNNFEKLISNLDK